MKYSSNLNNDYLEYPGLGTVATIIHS